METRKGLHDSANRLSAIIRAFPDMLFHINRDGKFLNVFRDDNPEAIFKSKDFSGRSIRDLFKGELAGLFGHAIEITLKDGNYENEFSIFWGKQTIISIKCSKLNENEIICIARDNTQQKEAKDALWKSEEKYRKLVENINEVIYETDKDWTIKYISPSIEKIMGYSTHEMTGRKIFEFAGEDSGQFAEYMTEDREMKEKSREFKIISKQGEVHWIRFTAKPVLINGMVTGRMGTMIDSTDEKKIELSLQKSERKYRLLAENINDVIWVVNITQKKAVYISPSIERLRGFTADEVMNQRLDEIFPQDILEKLISQIRSNIKDFLKNPSPREYNFTDVQQKCRDGRLIWTETIHWSKLTESGDIEVNGVTRNIDNRKNYELQLFKYAEELKISEEKFYNVFNNSPVGMVLSHNDRRGIIDANRQFLEATEYTLEEIIGKFSFDLGLFENKSQAIKLRDLFKTTGQINDFEITIRTKSGNLLTCLLSVHLLKLQDSEMLLTSAVDISRIRENEIKIEHLLKQQQLLSEISQLLNRPSDPEIVFKEVLMLLGQHTRVSRAYLFTDMPDEKPPFIILEWLNHGIESVKKLEEEAGNKEMNAFKEMLTNEGFIFSDNINGLPEAISRPLKKRNVVTFLMYPLYTENINCGAIGFDDCTGNKEWSSDEIDLLRTVSIIISNALERKKVLEKLSYSELKYKLAINSAKEGLWDWNIPARQVYYSEMWCILMGYDFNEISHDYKVWENSIYPDDKPSVMESLNNHLSGYTETYEIAYRIIRKDGMIRWVLDHGMVVERNDNNEPVRAIGMIIDITSQKESEIRLQDSIKTQQKLFSIISHDLRGPLGNFMQVLELLTKGYDLDEKMKDRLLEELKKSSRTTFSLLENLLNWSKSQTNVISLEPWYYSISKLLHDNVELAAPMANQKYINIIINTDDHLSVFCDRDSINLVIRNLLSNAIKFTREYGTIRASAREAGNYIEVEVEDNGVGMDEEIKANIFKSNAFKSSFGTNNEKGSGLGLVLCKDFVERNGGKLHVESTPGEGSRFVFSLPKN